MLADVCDLYHVGVEPRSFRSLGEGRLVHSRRAGADNNTVKEVILYCVYDEGLTALGTHILIILCEYDSGFVLHRFGDRVNVNGRGDVGAAPAYEYSYSVHIPILLNPCIF